MKESLSYPFPVQDCRLVSVSQKIFANSDRSYQKLEIGRFLWPTLPTTQKHWYWVSEPVLSSCYSAIFLRSPKITDRPMTKAQEAQRSQCQESVKNNIYGKALYPENIDFRWSICSMGTSPIPRSYMIASRPNCADAVRSLRVSEWF